VRAAKDWPKRAKIEDRSLFRGVDRHHRISADGLHPDSVGGIVKRMLARSGYKPHCVLRAFTAGRMATHAAINCATELEIMLRRYIREGQLFRAAAAGKLGF
jgi:hypothetical protein